MKTSKEIAFANILALETAASQPGLAPGKAKAMRQQAFSLRVKWGLCASKEVELKPSKAGHPPYRNGKYSVEKYAKVNPEHKDALGRYFAQHNKAIARPAKSNRTETIEVLHLN